MAVPKLRLKNENWKTMKLNQLFTKITLKNKGNTITNVISNSAQYGLVSQRDFFYKDIANSDNTEGYFVIEKNDFVYNPRKSNEAPYGPFNQYKLDEVGIVSPLYTCLRPKGTANSEYLKHYFSSPAWHKYMYANGNTGVRHDRVSITDDILMKMPVSMPNEQEQQKIADFLTTFDKRITAQQNIVADMEEIKKGLLQKVFGQEIRFKDENGEDYPAWKKKKISDLGTIITGNTPSTTNDDYYYSGFIPWITPSDISSDSAYIQDSERKLTLLGYSKARKLPANTVLITCIASIGKMAILTKAGSCNQQINAIIPNGINPYFILSLMQTLVPTMLLYAGKTATPILNKETFSKINCRLPCLEEQNKIASFLSAYDKKIEAEKKILADLHEMKKGLLQQMFV